LRAAARRQIATLAHAPCPNDLLSRFSIVFVHLISSPGPEIEIVCAAQKMTSSLHDL
jgi:hypothetical protein